ncbi:MAG TPA: nucleotidyltransferase domain-containing protein [Vitreimonas sp.]|uniref:nucleotidyltransferase family protein n=1 Tax=Vitreimonas sp. TaxID=3069702 RepID=UPI002D455497|nr:nucleotidyltransferase domain-containing protein [Vitreimonas sp.]HYD88923.1 nucleotidyltransferase domain-containing protein [Vitreimonas sp.]
MAALLDTVLETIRARRDDIEARYGIRLLGVVGSVARGEERPDSDVDITYQVTRGTTLFKLSDAAFELSSEFGREVDLVDRDGMRPAARAYIERDLVVA